MKKLKKREAIDRANKGCDAARLNPHNTHVANINARKPVWWVDIPLRKISIDGAVEIHLLLYDHRFEELYHFAFPTNYLRANKRRLVLRGDKKCISLELATDEPRLFQDVRPTGGGVPFAQFKKCTLK